MTDDIIYNSNARAEHRSRVGFLIAPSLTPRFNVEYSIQIEYIESTCISFSTFITLASYRWRQDYDCESH